MWLATEDLKIGDRFRTKIDEAIRLYDKLLLVDSKNSVGSPWVESEVEAAFEKERKQKRTVLFPIRLDDAVMETGQAWAAEIRRTRHRGDFRVLSRRCNPTLLPTGTNGTRLRMPSLGSIPMSVPRTAKSTLIRLPLLTDWYVGLPKKFGLAPKRSVLTPIQSVSEKVLVVVDQSGYYRLSSSRERIDYGLRGRYETSEAEAVHRSWD